MSKVQDFWKFQLLPFNLHTFSILADLCRLAGQFELPLFCIALGPLHLYYSFIQIDTIKLGGSL